MKKIDILHIYAGSSGSAGLYINSIFEALKKSFSQEVIVDYNFPFDYGRKIFYRFSDLSAHNFSKKQNKLRLMVRYLELILTLSYSFIFILKKKPKIINYSLTTQINIIYVFLKAAKYVCNCQLFITAHDVVPFETNYSKKGLARKRREKFFLIADKIIVHNHNSISDLSSVYNISLNKIIDYPFPIMNLEKLTSKYEISDKMRAVLKNDKRNFVFIGHLRREKGINILLDAWKVFTSNPKYKDNNLIIAGNIPNGFHYNFENLKNAYIYPKYLNDCEYKYLIKHAFCVILPYTAGTNSGIPSSVLTLNTILITSDIAMFKNNDIIDKNFMFKSGNYKSLVDKLIFAIDNGCHYNFNIFQEYENNFNKRINLVYRKNLSIKVV